MIIKESKKELYRDNVLLKAQLEVAIASNVELRLEIDKANDLINKTNTLIEEINERSEETKTTD